MENFRGSLRLQERDRGWGVGVARRNFFLDPYLKVTLFDLRIGFRMGSKGGGGAPRLKLPRAPHKVNPALGIDNIIDSVRAGLSLILNVCAHTLLTVLLNVCGLLKKSQEVPLHKMKYRH